MERQPQMIACALDPHHEGTVQWGWNGVDLFQKCTGQSKWVKVSRIRPTPKRLQVLAELTKRK